MSTAFDSISLGTIGKYGDRAFVPSNPSDRLPKHEAVTITSFAQYREYREKLQAEAAETERQKKIDRYTELFDKYGLRPDQRHYVFRSDLKVGNPYTPEYQQMAEKYR